ncbi:MAG: carbohydrate ABC transporter permease [Treponema sp.]|nr:carbohydrate ABC transporter permease [Treponema sp.]
MITLAVTVITIFFGCIVNGIAAFSFATFKFRFKNIIYAIVLLSFMIPFEAIAMPLYNVVNQFQWVDTLHGIIIPSIADGLVLFLFTQFFRDIPASLVEAARVDGASWMTVYIRIIMPSSIPVFVTAGLMTFMNQWNSYMWPLLIARRRSIQMIQIALSSFRGERNTLWACLYAGSIISALIPLFLFLPFQKYFVQGIISSGVKG